MLPAIKLLNRR